MSLSLNWVPAIYATEPVSLENFLSSFADVFQSRQILALMRRVATRVNPKGNIAVLASESPFVGRLCINAKWFIVHFEV